MNEPIIYYSFSALTEGYGHPAVPLYGQSLSDVDFNLSEEYFKSKYSLGSFEDSRYLKYLKYVVYYCDTNNIDVFGNPIAYSDEVVFYGGLEIFRLIFLGWGNLRQRYEKVPMPFYLTLPFLPLSELGYVYNSSDSLVFFSLFPVGYSKSFSDLVLWLSANKYVSSGVRYYPAASQYWTPDPNYVYTYSEEEYFMYKVYPDFLNEITLLRSGPAKDAQAMLTGYYLSASLAVASAESDSVYYEADVKNETLSQIEQANTSADYQESQSYIARQQAIISLVNMELTLA